MVAGDAGHAAMRCSMMQIEEASSSVPRESVVPVSDVNIASSRNENTLELYLRSGNFYIISCL